MHLHLHLPHLRLSALAPAAVLLSMVYAAAIAVALADPGRHTLAGLVVLAGLTARWTLLSRRPAPSPMAAAVADTVTAVDAVLPAEPAPAVAA
jgi:hypothetical protein